MRRRLGTRDRVLISADGSLAKVLIQADGFNPPATPATATPANISPFQLGLANNIQRLRLQIDRIIPVHLPADGRKVTLNELWIAAGIPAARAADAR